MPSSTVTMISRTRRLKRQCSLAQQDPCLSLAFDYAEHDLYAMIAYHRERLRSAPISVYTLKSVMWQLLNGLSYLEQVRAGAARSLDSMTGCCMAVRSCKGIRRP